MVGMRLGDGGRGRMPCHQQEAFSVVSGLQNVLTILV